MTASSTSQKNFQLFIAAIAGAAVILQFPLMIVNRIAGIPETVVRFFSFFTILTNILVAVMFAILAAGKESRLHRFFSSPSVQTAVTVYILVVGLVYNIILRWQWELQGLQLYVDETLHVVTPALTLIYWVIYVPSGKLSWKDTFPWLLYPLIYLIYIMTRGYFSDFYPYFFMNAKELGFEKAMINAGYVTAAFLLISLLMVGLGRVLKK